MLYASRGTRRVPFVTVRFGQRLTPELSRAAKRRRLGRIVRPRPADAGPPTLGPSERTLVGRGDELAELCVRDGSHVDDCDPVKPSQIACRLEPRNIGELEEALSGRAEAEAPLLRLAGFEVGELLSSHVVDQDVARRTVELRRGVWIAGAQFFDRFDIHGLPLAA